MLGERVPSFTETLLQDPIIFSPVNSRRRDQEFEVPWSELKLLPSDARVHRHARGSVALQQNDYFNSLPIDITVQDHVHLLFGQLDLRPSGLSPSLSLIHI